MKVDSLIFITLFVVVGRQIASKREIVRSLSEKEIINDFVFSKTLQEIMYRSNNERY